MPHPPTIPHPASPAVWPAVRMVARTDTGLQRSNNEDAVAIHPDARPWPLAVLADGMGGYSAGEIASAMAVKLVPAALLDLDVAPARMDAALRDALRLANAAIFSAARSTPGCQGMATTVVAAAMLPGHVVFAHLGDSRAYGWRQGRLTRITHDHSLLQREIDAGNIREQDAHSSGLGHLVTRALGVDHEVDPEITRWPLQAGDRIMLCSDGLTDMLTDTALDGLFARQAPLPVLLTALIAAANAAGGHDNIGIILMEAAAGSPQPAPPT
jgi:protein phosphatase